MKIKFIKHKLHVNLFKFGIYNEENYIIKSIIGIHRFYNDFCLLFMNLWVFFTFFYYSKFKFILFILLYSKFPL